MGNLHGFDETLLQAIGAIEALLALPGCDVAELSRIRYRTARAVAARRRAMDELFTAAAKEEGSAWSDAVKALRAGNFEMRMYYTDHTVAWPTARAVAEWPAYVVASRKLAAVMRQQVAAERAALYPERRSLGV